MTHWQWCLDLQQRFPDVQVESDRIFVRDGSVYTSAGVTAGIDLALALVEEDLGSEAALSVARDLVLYLRRQGGQSQVQHVASGTSRRHPRLRRPPHLDDGPPRRAAAGEAPCRARAHEPASLCSRVRGGDAPESGPIRRGAASRRRAAGDSTRPPLSEGDGSGVRIRKRGRLAPGVSAPFGSHASRLCDALWSL